MQRVVFIVLILWLSSCSSKDGADSQGQVIDSKDTINDSTPLTVIQSPLRKLSVIVLPPYDEIANAGISPDVQVYLEREISKDTSLTVIKFPYRELTDVPYHNVFDKKYCKPIIEKIKPDIIVMTRLDLKERTGNMSSDKWNLAIRIYCVKTDHQIDSRIKASDLPDVELSKLIELRQQELVAEIKSNANKKP